MHNLVSAWLAVWPKMPRTIATTTPATTRPMITARVLISPPRFSVVGQREPGDDERGHAIAVNAYHGATVMISRLWNMTAIPHT